MTSRWWMPCIPACRRAWSDVEQVIEVGPMSGKSNVVYWLEKRGLPITDEIVDRIFTKAKSSSSVLTEEEILTMMTGLTASGTND